MGRYFIQPRPKAGTPKFSAVGAGASVRVPDPVPSDPKPKPVKPLQMKTGGGDAAATFRLVTRHTPLVTASRLAAPSDRPAELLDAIETRLDRLEIGRVAEAHGFVVAKGDARNDAVIGRDWTVAFWLVALQLPLYMLHRFEEHDADRFRLFVNELTGEGRDILTRLAVFVVNVPGVWGVNLAAIALAGLVNLSFGLVAVWLTLLNGVVHVVQAVALRRYNPGLFTAIVLSLPAGIAGVWALHASGHGSAGWQMLGFAVATAIHVAIVAHVRRRMKSVPAL